MGVQFISDGGNLMQAIYPNVAIDDNFIIAGPLNLNKRMMRADTVMGERLQLNPQQFRTLLMLVSNEGITIPFEELHMFMTMPGEEKFSIQAARDVIVTLVNIVNISGRGFAKITMLPNDEFMFVTKWGMDWRNADEHPKTDQLQDRKESCRQVEGLSKAVLSVAMIVAIAVFIGSYFAFQDDDDGLVYIPVMQIPLAGMPDVERSTPFPYIRENTFYVSPNNSIYLNTHNTHYSDAVFMLLLNAADELAHLSLPVLVPRGEALVTIYLVQLLEPGRQMVELTLKAFCGNLLTETDSVVKQITVYVP